MDDENAEDDDPAPPGERNMKVFPPEDEGSAGRITACSLSNDFLVYGMWMADQSEKEKFV